MPSQELFQAQPKCSTAHHTTLRELPGSPTGITSPSALHAHPTETVASELIAALWRVRLELAIFKLERRAVPVLNVFHNRRCHPGRTVPPQRRQRHEIPEASATPSPTRLLQARRQPTKCKTRVLVSLRHMLPPRRGTHRGWLKWRGALPVAMNSRRHSVRGSAVFAHRCRQGRRLVMHFWVQQRVERHVAGWSRLGSITLTPRQRLTEKGGEMVDGIRR
ncbi:hypothetical protein HD554DRAFT_2135398 [Boletus coccyginus]|nr:hypothetical protein HD554DRAFT_2135398 [Boletus coccyginus]